MDDLLALMGSDNEDDAISSDHNTKQASREPSHQVEDIASRKNKTITSRNSQSAPSQSTTPSNGAAAGSIDPYTKIRIVQRRTGKVELVDLLAPFQFVTTAGLANMNKAQISALITHPSNNNDSESPSGRSSMASMGIVFSNSGTRMSKNGRAFSIITLGDLHTGPTVSIFLFGHAYSDFTTKIQTGSVIAVVGSSIMPSRQGGETRISLSVNDIQQLILVGKAVDYGTCAGEDTRKNYSNNGQGHSNVKAKCKSYVDLRLGRFCKFHKKKQLQSQGGAKKHSHTGVKKNMTFMQGMRAETDMRKVAMARMASRGSINQSIPSNNMTIVMPGMGTVVAAHVGTSGTKYNSLTSSNKSHQRGALGGSKALEQALGMSNVNFGIGTMAAPANKSMQRAPKQMSISNTSTTARRTTPAAGQIGLKVSSSGISNPYLSKTTVVPVNRNVSQPTQSLATNDILGQVLAPHRRSATHAPLTKSNPEKRKRNLVHMKGMNGQVQVPKPNTLFNQAVAPNSYNSTPYIAQIQPITPSPQQKSAMREQQKALAERLKHGKTSANIHKIMHKSKSKSDSSSGPPDLDSILGMVPLSDEKRASVLEAKSKYSLEADAESYAKSRKVISELEKQEAKHDKIQARKTQAVSGTTPGSTGTTKIVSEYKCLTCKKITQYTPLLCISANHKVKIKREIKKQESTIDKRLNLKTRSADDGGMILGAGLEWSEWGGK